MYVNNLPKVVTRKTEGRDLNPQPCESQVQRPRVDFRVVRTDPLCFQAGERKRRPNLAFVFRIYFYIVVGPSTPYTCASSEWLPLLC